MRKYVAFFFIVVAVILASFNVSAEFKQSIQDRLFQEFDKKMEKYDTVDVEIIEGVPTYMLNLKGTDLSFIEAYLEKHKDKFVLYEEMENGKLRKEVLKKIRSRHT